MDVVSNFIDFNKKSDDEEKRGYCAQVCYQGNKR